ncbi:hypothetical protein [Sulfitobacter sp. JB4-11]|uniref:hypothetical protein n=1 Tax=Sulfitobacter rhodophyticola TaxID=3238304 RepID=UPI003516D01F
MSTARWIILGLLYLGLLVTGWFASGLLAHFEMLEILPENEARVNRMIMISLSVFVVTSALPFVPGAEIGIALLMLFGAPFALIVYVGMVLALTLGFALGRLIPMHALARFFGLLRFRRAQAFIDQMAKLTPEESLALLSAKAPVRWVPWLLRHRYLALIVLFNLPGNSALGGGGGIAFVAGFSRLFSVQRYLAAVLVAVAPVPLYFALAAAFA